MLNWKYLLSTGRRKDKKKSGSKAPADFDRDPVRTEFERDYDRLLFSTPVRRLGDKTQVFPLEPNESVRTRLTHSHEVSNLARSIGVKIAFGTSVVPTLLLPQRNVPALLAAIGLAHDLGNPPFGHQGEESIRSWFSAKDANDKSFFGGKHGLDKAMKMDFLKFDGNAQTFRLVTRLQILNDNFGLNLTYGTLAAIMKYTVASNKTNKKSENASQRKHGFFQSEKHIVREVQRETGLREGMRHPLTYIMEACDDIAYSVLDTEDAVKKGLVSFSDVIAYLKNKGDGDEVVNAIVVKALHKYDEYKLERLSPTELNDISMQMFRVYAIAAMVKDVTETFEKHIAGIMDGTYRGELICDSRSAKVCKVLKEFSLIHAFKHRSVLKVELKGHNILIGLMDLFWEAITNRESVTKVASDRKTPFTRYAYSRISENYRRVFESETAMPIRYREAQLLTDMISGMTDSYALTLFEELKSHHE